MSAAIFAPARPPARGGRAGRAARPAPPPGKARLAGADASHAWVAAWCGPAFGWLGLDPTNAIPEGDDHVVVARGRDYADVPPVDGVVLASGGRDFEVEVDV